MVKLSKEQAEKYKREVDFSYNLKIYYDIVKKYKVLFIVLLVLGLVLEAVLLVDSFLFKVIVDQGTEFIAGNLAQEVFVSSLIFVGLIFGTILIFRSAGNLIMSLYHHRLIANIQLDLKRRFFNHIIGLSTKFHTTNKTGSLISRLIRGGNAIDRITGVFLFEISPLFFQILIVAGAFLAFGLVPAVIVILVALVFIVYSVTLQHYQKNYQIIANDSEDNEKANISDVFMNIDSIKYFGKEDFIKGRYLKLGGITKRTSVKFWNFWSWMGSGQILIVGLGTLSLIYYTLTQFLSGSLSLGSLVFIYTAYGNLLAPMNRFVGGIRGFYQSMGDLENLSRYGKIKNSIPDRVGAKNIEVKKGSIEFRNVYFNYPRRKKGFAFDKFNLKIKPNEKIALVGHSGCGKTSLIKLLYRLYEVQSGGIYVDGENIKKFKQESLRSELSIVPQEAVLFDDSIYNNILFSDPKATKADVMKAIKLARLDEVVERFPRKEKTIVGERGVKLSGGEKQRVSIARALLANKKILVLDEATSALDSETEYEIQKDLDKLLEKRTSIIIAHRLSTIMKADRIVVLDKGEIVQIGPHRKLIKEAGPYKRLWNLQKGGYLREK